MSSPFPRLCLVCAAAMLLCAGPTAPARAQDTGEPPPAVRALDLDAIERRIAELEATASTATEAAKTELSLLKSTQSFVQQAAKDVAQFDELTRSAQAAPDRLRQVEAELAAPVSEPQVSPPPGAKPAELTPQLEAARAQLEAARRLKEDVERDAAMRAERHTKIPEEVVATKQRLEDVIQSLAAPANGVESVALREARNLNLSAERSLLEAKQTRLDQEIRSYDARRELLRARRQQVERQLLEGQRLVDAWTAVVTTAQTRVAAEAQRDAERTRRSAAANAHAVVQSIAEENAAYTKDLTRVLQLKQALAEKKQTVDKALSTWSRAFDNVTRSVDQIGATDAIGMLLRTQRAQLPDVRETKAALADRRTEINRVQLRRIALEDNLLELVDIDRQVRRLIAESRVPVTAEQHQDVLEAAATELTKQKEYVANLITAYDAYFDTTLTDLQTAEAELVELVHRYHGFIDQNVLWIQSHDALWVADGGTYSDAIGWFVQPQLWAVVPTGIAHNFRRHPFQTLTMAILMLVLAGMYRPMRSRLHAIAEKVWRAGDRFGLTVSAAGITVARAATAPLLLLCLTWRLEQTAQDSRFIAAIAGVTQGADDPQALAALAAADGKAAFLSALAVAVQRSAVLLFSLALLRQLCVAKGLAEVHFRWSAANLSLVRRHLRWYTPAAITLAFVAIVMSNQAVDAYMGSIGRLAFIAVMLLTAVLLRRLLHPDSGVARGVLKRHQGGWLDRLRYVWYPFLVFAPLVLAIATALGYVYTGTQLGVRMFFSVELLLLILVGHALLLRLLFVAQRRLAIEQARKKAAAQARQMAKESSATGAAAHGAAAVEVPPPVEDVEVNVAQISAQARRLLRSGAGFAAVLALVLVWADVLPAFGILRNVELWSQTQSVVAADGTSSVAITAITLADLVLGLIILAVTVGLSRNIPGLLEIAILQRLPISPAGRYATTTMVRYCLAITGVVIAFSAVGVGWAKVQWLAAAMTVGLGFGLQEIFANFISGLIILFEQPVRVGDTVTVGQISGTISRIRTRATTITDWDRKELIIPNKEFVTGQVINWSLSDAILRVRIPVGIAYGSDTDAARERLIHVARANERVLQEPPPQAVFWGFGASSLDFELRVFIPSIEHLVPVRDELHQAIDDAFRKANIEIAFPQRDIHVRSIQAALPFVERVPAPQAGEEVYSPPNVGFQAVSFRLYAATPT